MNRDEDALRRVERIREMLPKEGLFEAKTWRVSPEAFPLSARHVAQLEKIGVRLQAFLRACNLLYRQSVAGKAPPWVAAWLDAGKPEHLVALGRDAAHKNDLPRVIRPDLVLEEEGFALAEIDAVPGGVGLTAWLGETYGGLGDDIVGGTEGMRQGFRAVFPEGNVVVAQEASAYRPEWEWLVGADRVRSAENYRFDGRPVYRFFEHFDWDGLGSLRGSYRSGQVVTPPLKPFLEEKLWLALLWMKPLREFWRRELGEAYLRDLLALVPQGWPVDPAPLPPTAVLPGLEVHSWEEVKLFSQKQRELVLKISGFSPLAWGSRGVLVGSDLAEADWSAAIDRALGSFEVNPWLMQRFRKGARVRHRWHDPAENRLVEMEGRARVCPYYFAEGDRVVLRGVLVTLCPADKKLLHGMSDAILVPASRGGE